MRTIKLLRSLITAHGWEDDVHIGENGHTRLFFTDEEEEEDLVEYTAAMNAGVPWDGITRLTKEEMIDRYGATYPGVSIPAGSLWPVKLATKLFQLSVSEAQTLSVSLQLHTHTPVESIERLPTVPSSRTPARWAVHTPRGTLKARFIIHATNAWAAHLLPQFSMPQQPGRSTPDNAESAPSLFGTWIAPYRGQIIATRAKVSPSQLPRTAFAADWMEDYWLPRYDTCPFEYYLSSPYLSRPVHGFPDDNENALVVLGGGRDSLENATELGVSDDTSLNPRLSESLRGVLPTAFPQFFDKDTEPEMEWVRA
jgi:glycine/D-amino acid oxidase-like deaminating enzyme